MLRMVATLLVLCGCMKGICPDTCKTGFYQHTKECKECPSSCSSCMSDVLCTKCKAGFYGDVCSNNCSDTCKDYICLQSNGDCLYCAYGHYQNTEKICNKCPENCLSCKSETDCYECKIGLKGEFCQEKCINCKPGTGCAKDTGNCYDSCNDGYSGLSCNATCNPYCASCQRLDPDTCLTCAPTRYGDKCEKACSKECKDNLCNHIGGYCTHGCKAGFWGNMCEDLCPVNCLEIVCFRNNGSCSDGCLYNFTGSDCVCPSDCTCDWNGTCVTCNEGSNFMCGQNCSSGCEGNICFRDTTECLNGCRYGYHGIICGHSHEDSSDEGVSRGSLASIVVAIIVVCIIVAGVLMIIVVWILYVRRRKIHLKRKCRLQNTNTEEAEQGSPLTDTGAPTTDQNFPHGSKLPDEYSHVAKDEEHITSVDREADSENLQSENEKVKTRSLTHSEPEVKKRDNRDCLITRIELRNLESIVKNMTTEDSFTIEFQQLPCNTDNKALQRGAEGACSGVSFQRPSVMVAAGPNDYLNACFIDGYKQKQQYIACTGPTDRFPKNMQLFWDMVWEERCAVIVMLVEPKEIQEKRCIRYWPTEGTKLHCAGLTIENQNETLEDRFIERRFSLKKGSEIRSVVQLQYTDWPDEKIPKDFISLLKFRGCQHLLMAEADNPIVVHCRDGMGRTGTYIALDILIEEGSATSYVNIFACVEQLRKQRTNIQLWQNQGKKMVQTPEQYAFLHRGLVNWYQQFGEQNGESQMLPVIH